MTRHIPLIAGAFMAASCAFVAPAAAQPLNVVLETAVAVRQEPQKPLPATEKPREKSPKADAGNAEQKPTTTRVGGQRVVEYRAPSADAAHSGPNVRIEVTLTDEKPGSPSTTKTVMVTTSSQNWGRLRSEVNSNVYGGAPLNIDARPIVLQDGRISLQLTIEYSQGRLPDAQSNPERIALVRLNESLTSVLESGKPLLVTQSADPTSDRKVTIEVKATVLR